MNFIFDFNFRLAEAENWIFSINHLFLFAFFILSMLALYYGVHTKTKRGIAITKIVLIVVLVTFELGRMLWTYMERNNRGLDTNFIDWVRIWSFEICAIMVWVTVGTLIASLFVNKDNKTLIIIKNIMFGAATMGAFLTFIFPDHIDSYRPIFHWRNLQTVTTHLLLIYVPFYFVKIGELEIKIKNLWMSVLGFIGVASINMTAAHLSGVNFFGALMDRHVIHIIGTSLPHPLHYIIIFILAFAGTCILYGLAQVMKKDKNEKETKINEDRERKLEFIDILPYITGFAATMLMLYMPMFLGADFSSVEHYSYRALKSWTALFILVPFILQVVFMYILENNKKNKE